MGSVYEQQNTILNTDEFCDFRIQLFEQSVLKLARNKSSVTPQTTFGDTATECFLQNC